LVSLYLAKMRVVLYTKPGCHLCEEVESWLLEAGVTWQSVDITTNVTLFERYKQRIPVMDVDESEALCAPITRADVRRVVAGE
jgi:glutaredoxin